MPVLVTFGRGLFYYGPVILLLAAWDLASRTGVLSPSLAPSPGSTAAALWNLLASGDLAYHAAMSLYRQLTGLGLSIVVGILLGVGMARIEWVRILFRAPITFIYPLPKTALIPILLVWFGLGHLPQIAAVFLGCLLPIVISAYNGARGVDAQLVWSARSLGAGRVSVLRKVIFMAALPDILSGMRTALALSWLLLISTEMIIAQQGLGYLVSFYGEGGAYANMFAAVLVVIMLGYLSDRGFLALLRRTLRWRALPQ
jgi:ABC-type nitrate/sulfonate/bicarbonate transport system permease component